MSKQSSTLSEASLSQGEFDRMININFPQVLAAADDIGFESMRSDATSITSTGLSTLYLQARSTSTPSIPVVFDLSESTKKAINNLERCLQDIGPESGIGISPADIGDSCNNQAGSSSLRVPSSGGLDENKWSLNSSLEVGEEGVDAEEVYQPAFYTTPDNRVERQLYSLDGNHRSSFESVYSPPVVTEQVVNEVRALPSPKPTVILQDDRPRVRPVKEVYPPPRICQKIDLATTHPATSVTTSISEIISSPQTEATLSIPGNEGVEDYEREEGVTDNSNTRSETTLGKKGTHLHLNQSEKRDAKAGHHGVFATAVTVPITGDLEAVETKITPKPRMQSTCARLSQPESEIVRDYDWAKKVQEIAQWQADVNLALKDDHNDDFIGSPCEESIYDEISETTRRPRPTRRRLSYQAESHRSPIQPPRNSDLTFNGNKLESMVSHRPKKID